jgi:hypothetical protein
MSTRPSTKSNPFRRYAAAHAKCQRLSGDALNKAQDEERDAIKDIEASGTRGVGLARRP